MNPIVKVISSFKIHGAVMTITIPSPVTLGMNDNDGS
jgi:hypothetical protein